MPIKKTLNLFIFLIIINVAVFSTFGVMFYLFGRNAADISDKTALIKEQIQKQESVAMMKKDLADNREEIGNLNKYVVGSDGVVDFIKSVEKMSSGNSLKSEIKSVTFEPVTGYPSENTELMRIRLDSIGEWKDVVFLLKTLEDYPLNLVLQSVSFSKFSDYQSGKKTIPQWLGSFDFTVLKMKN
jgi:hypothetical protein